MLVRPIIEYVAPIWDPYYNTDIYKLEKVQRRAARWILSEYSRTTSVTSLLSVLNIRTYITTASSIIKVNIIL